MIIRTGIKIIEGVLFIPPITNTIDAKRNVIRVRKNSVRFI